MSEVRLYKLENGDEIIGRLVKEEVSGSLNADPTVTLTSVRQIIMHQTAPGQIQVGMIPWMVGIPDGDVVVYLNKVLGKPDGELPKKLEDEYLNQTSKIALATGMGNLT